MKSTREWAKGIFMVLFGLAVGISASQALAQGDKPPTISLSPTSLSFSATRGGHNPDSETVNITNKGGGTLNWTASVSVPPFAPSFLTISPTSGTATPTNPSSITVSANIFGLSAETYNATIIISAEGSTNTPQTIPVTLIIREPSSTISLSPTSLSFSATQGGPNPTPQWVNITNTGGGTLNWTASTTATWLSVSSKSGTAPDSISVSANISGLSAETYSATIIISAPGATNTPQNIPVTLTIAKPLPTISQSPTSLTFSAIRGGSNPTPQTVNITNTGGGTLNWSASVSNPPLTPLYLIISPTSGTAPSTITVSANILGLSSGTHSATITITAPDATNTPQNIPVTLTITEPPSTISLSPTSLSFSATRGGSNPTPQTVNITNTGGGKLNWSASTTATWLSISPKSGTAPSSITLSANISGLLAGTHSDTITITAPGATNTPQNIPVTLTITEPLPTISLSPTSLSFSATKGGSNPTSQTVSVRNTGGGMLNWTASTTATWLSISSISGTAPSTITVSVDISGLPAGTATATITISAPDATNTPQNIPVTLTITEPLPTISLSPTPLNFSATQGGPNPTPQTVNITNTGGSTLNWTASTLEPSLSISPTSGTAPSSITVSVNISGMPAGTHNATITISAPGATNTPQNIRVTLTISISPPPSPLAISPTIVQAGFQLTRLTLSAASGGKVTFGVTVIADEEEMQKGLRIEVFYTTISIFGDPILISLGLLKKVQKNLYEMEISGIPPGALPVGEIPLPGINIEVRDSKGRRDKWPIVVIGGEGTGLPVGSVAVPKIALTKASSPVPIIFQAGFGLSHLLLSPTLGGTFTLQATVFGGQGALNVQAFFETVDVFGKKVPSKLGDLKDEDGDGVYELKITIPPGILGIGEIPIPGLRVTGTDGIGQTDAWPNLVIWR